MLAPAGTNLGSLTPTVTAASGWTCTATEAQDFSGPVEYRFVRDGTGQEQAYTVTAQAWRELVFNKTASGTATAGAPVYYGFYVSSGVNYTFSSGAPASTEFKRRDGTSWFTLNGSESRTADFTEWVIVKFEGSYNLGIKSGEAVAGDFAIGSSSTASVNEADKTISVLVPYGTNLGSLTPMVTAASGWTCATTGAQNFSGPVEYRFVRDGTGQEQVYTVTAQAWRELVFNKTASGTATAGAPVYYGFYVSSGVNYTFSSGAPASIEFKRRDGTSWFTLNGSESRTADFTEWVIVKFEGSYDLGIKSGEAAASGFIIGSSSTASINEADKTISVLVPYGTNLGSLTPTVTPASGWTCATAGAQNFSGPVEYRFAKDVGQAQAYTVTVTRRGQGDITIIPPDGDINIAGFPAAPFTVYRNGSLATYTIQISDTGFSNYEWYVDDTQKTVDSGNDNRNFTVRASDYAIGSHTVTLIVYKNGVPYSNKRRFTVAN